MTKEQVLDRAQQIWGAANVLYVEPPTGGNCWEVRLCDNWAELLPRLLPGEDSETFETTRHSICNDDGYAACHHFCGEVLDVLSTISDGIHIHSAGPPRIQ